MIIGVISYAAAAFTFGLFAILLITRWRGHLQGGWLLAAVVLTALWAASACYSSSGHPQFLLIALEGLRNLAWLMFMLRLLKPIKPPAFLGWFVPTFIICVLLMDLFPFAVGFGQTGFSSVTLSILGHLVQAVIGLSLVEQLFRYTEENRRWSVKHLYIGIACVFAYDFYLYADTLLFRQTDLVLWQVRGFVWVMVVPLIAISTARNLPKAILLSVSHTAAFNMTTVFGASLYLIAMAAAGYYVREFEGTWGAAFQILFLFLAVLLLLVLVFSHRFRARTQVLLSKHFLHYKYDYRNEWINLLDALANKGDNTQLRVAAIHALARIVTAESGMLWCVQANGGYQCDDGWNMPRVDEHERIDGALIAFLRKTNYVINLHEYEARPEEYSELRLPKWLLALDDPWLIVPLLQQNELLGFIVLGKPMVKRDINWEDRDFLLAAGRHIAGYLALLETSEALSQARQFEAFNRLSAYVVHDLKNVAAQLGLVISNAEKHKDNPAFMQDALATVENAVDKMNRMLGHLREERVEVEQKEAVDVVAVLDDVIQQRSSREPVPTVQASIDQLRVFANKDRFEAVLTHLIQNAQEATDKSGYVKVAIRADSHKSTIEIMDNGCGMDAEFIRHRLFKPFDTTKGNAGMGIGVYEGREFVHLLGGQLDVNSEPGIGTTFTISLPTMDVQMKPEKQPVVAG